MDENLNPVEEPKAQKPITPAEFLASIPGAPSPQQIETWKREVPSHRVKLFAPDKDRAFIVRGISGLEMASIQKTIPANATDPDGEVQRAAVEKAVLWTNTTASGKLTRTELLAGSAGLPLAIFTVIAELSDYLAPEYIEQVSGEL